MAEIVEAAEAAEEFIGEMAEVASTPGIGWITVGAWAAGLAGGLAAGYMIAVMRLETKYSKIAEDEIAEMKAHYLAKEKARGPKPDIEVLANDQIIKEAKYAPPIPKPETIGNAPRHARDGEVVAVDVSVFDSKEEAPEFGWDYAEEHKRRNGEDPYVIHRDEMDELENYESITFTYYEQDDVLADETDKVVDDRNALLGDGLSRFGQGSGDPNIVIVRNPELSTEFEVVKSNGSFAEEVHGFLQHEEEPRRHGRVRFDDE